MQTVDSQRYVLESYIKSKGWEADYFEEVQSTRKTRPVKAAMLQKLRNKEYDGCIVSKLDRFARSSTELILEIDELIRKNIFFISINDNLDFSTASGRLQFQILCAFSEFERALISQRTRESLFRIKHKDGKTLGRPPGSTDKKKRRKAGYFIREANKKKAKDELSGVYLPLTDYLNHEAKNSVSNN